MPAGQPQQATVLNNMAGAMVRRFERLETADLSGAVDAIRQAVAVSPPGDPKRAMYLSHLGVCLRRRFEHAGDAADLDDAVEGPSGLAVASTPARHPNSATYQLNLGFSLRTRFERAGNVADLRAAVDAMEQAVPRLRPASPNAGTTCPVSATPCTGGSSARGMPRTWMPP